MLQVTLTAIFALSLFLPLVAQEEGRPVGAEPPSVLRVGDVNYWGQKRPSAPKRSHPKNATVWAEPIRLPDGRFSTYVPAPQVLRFLDNPTPEGAREYLEWQHERLSKLSRAMELLERLSVPEEPPKPDPADGPGPIPPFEILYFKQAHCVYCDRQDPIIAQLRAREPDLSIREVAKGQSPELWKEFGVEVTPTLVIVAGKKPVATLRGLASQAQILSALRKGNPHEK